MSKQNWTKHCDKNCGHFRRWIQKLQCGGSEKTATWEEGKETAQQSIEFFSYNVNQEIKTKMNFSAYFVHPPA